MSKKGQLVIPATYRRAHKLKRGSIVALVELGEALVLIPHDEMLATVTSRLEASLKGTAVSTDELFDATEEARPYIVLKEFGEPGE